MAQQSQKKKNQQWLNKDDLTFFPSTENQEA
jgi:hypothetical protein